MRRILFAACAGLVTLSSTLDGRDALRMDVTPAVARAPAVLTVRVTVAPEPDNRTLEVIAESADFFRSSQVQVDGDRASALNVVQFRGLPTGLYRVTGVLVGVNGRRAAVTRVAKVEPSPGADR